VKLLLLLTMTMTMMVVEVATRTMMMTTMMMRTIRIEMRELVVPGDVAAPPSELLWL
jgi:hypothetical protein